MQTRSSRLARKAVAVQMAVALMLVVAGRAGAQEGAVVTNGTSTGITTANGFLFEPEVPFVSLKYAPTWSELEQLLDNPYAFTLDPVTPGNDQGFPSYRSAVNRRPAFGVTLPQFIVHPLNYNTTTGEEMRLINPKYPGGLFLATDRMIQTGANTYRWLRVPRLITPGSRRVQPGEPAIDYNNPVAPDPIQPGAITALLPGPCVTSLELNPPEGALLCGGDPGEPNYGGFGFRSGSAASPTGYSTPAVPLNALAAAQRNPGTNISGLSLYDPEGCTARNADSPGSCTGQGTVQRLRKPTLRRQPTGAITVADYAQNSNPDDVRHSNENDYIRGNSAAQRRLNAAIAIVLGKSLFWDMQVGSDSVQSCGTCHFNGTGTDTRTKNQLNPNHLGGDNTLQVGDTPLASEGGNAGMAANYTLKASDFPLHRVTDPDIAGDPACGSALEADVSGVPYMAQPAGYAASQRFSNPVSGTVTVCDASNIERDSNDVVSSMGVHWGIFKDLQLGLGPVANGVRSARPDVRESALDCATAVDPKKCLAEISDPIPAFAGNAGTHAGVLNQFRRVEPRNTPTMQAAGFNFDNFWDGRARHDFNGGSVFGAADPQSHVFVGNATGALTATRQIIRFTSLASLSTGPALSEFEMSYFGRNWAKIGKKLLQADITPLANQLVDPNDSVLGPYSNNRNAPAPGCVGLSGDNLAPGIPAVGKPGLCISYRGLIRQAFEPVLYQNTSQHLNGCYTDGRTEIHPNQCGSSAQYPAAAVRVLEHGDVVVSAKDPFDGYVLSIADGPAVASETNQFTQMEANFSLFWGLALQQWVNVLVPDNTPLDQFLDLNPDSFNTLGEPGEAGLVADQLDCTSPGQRDCFTPFGNFRRDQNLTALRNPTGEGGTGTLVTNHTNLPRGPNAPDPLLGFDIFFASNLSLKNPNFRTGRCGECHAIPTLTDHTMPFTSKINLGDAVAEFSTPGVELIVEPLARLRVITGFLLESEINENGQDAVERRIVDQSIVPNPTDGLAYPGATPGGLPGFGAWTGADSAFLDNGMYNLGIRPIAEDIGRGGNDAFGWPLSIATLMMKNLAGPDFNPGGDDPADNFAQPAQGPPVPGFDPDDDCFGLFEPSAQDPRINPGCDGEPEEPALGDAAPYLASFVNNITVGDFPPEMDEAGGAIGGMVNTLTDVAMIEGFMDTLGPFNSGNVAAEVMNFGGFTERPGDIKAQMGTWPNINRVGRMGAFKAAPLRNVELTGPYFHNGGKLTLRQVVDFYTRGGDFPITNAAHRDFNLVNMDVEIQSNLSEEEKVALVDFLIELTDDRNRWARAPFDHPEVIVPFDGEAPENTAGRAALLANPLFRRVAQVGATGRPPLNASDPFNTGPEPSFLNVTSIRPGQPGFNCNPDAGPISHYCH